ncbi:MAG TPA: transcription antitermination factor NusB [Micropepsaceae bacterium]|jgi:N utilization substance protein B|nr:transcription antitermination factor NusB [Micropepsaceae bacterium]
MKSPVDQHETRSAARLAALQALYQLEMTGVAPGDVVEEFIQHRLGHDIESGKLVPNDEAFFSDIVHGVLKHQVEIDRSVARSLASGWTLTRIDSILRALLRAATYELVARRDVPAKVVIDEYVELARDFFEGDEPGFVNAVLDRLAHRKRAAEFGETPPDDELQF